MELVFLTELSDQITINILCSMLKDNDIPYNLKHKGLGAYQRVTMGSSIYAASIYVESSNYEKARELLEIVTSPYKEPSDSYFDSSFEEPNGKPPINASDIKSNMKPDLKSDFTPLKESDNKTYYIGKTIIRFFIIFFMLISVILFIVSFVSSLSDKPITSKTTYSKTVCVIPDSSSTVSIISSADNTKE